MLTGVGEYSKSRAPKISESGREYSLNYSFTVRHEANWSLLNLPIVSAGTGTFHTNFLQGSTKSTDQGTYEGTYQHAQYSYRD